MTQCGVCYTDYTKKQCFTFNCFHHLCVECTNNIGNQRYCVICGSTLSLIESHYHCNNCDFDLPKVLGRIKNVCPFCRAQIKISPNIVAKVTLDDIQQGKMSPEILEEFLRDHSLNPNIYLNNIGNILHNVCLLDDPELIKLVVKYGADVFSENKQGKLPISIAQKIESIKALLDGNLYQTQNNIVIRKYLTPNQINEKLKEYIQKNDVKAIQTLFHDYIIKDIPFKILIDNLDKTKLDKVLDIIKLHFIVNDIKLKLTKEILDYAKENLHTTLYNKMINLLS